jgi:hypothetical protein
VPPDDGRTAHGRAKLEATAGQVAAAWRETALEPGAEPLMAAADADTAKGRQRGEAHIPARVMTSG